MTPLFPPRLRRMLALAWLALVLATGAYLGLRFYQGFVFRTDLTALLPREESDDGLRKATEVVTASLSRRVIVMVGHRDAAQARAAAGLIQAALQDSGLLSVLRVDLAGRMARDLGALYFPHRGGLLSDSDRRDLAGGHGQAVARRALSQIFGPVPVAGAELIREDPFLLLPAFFAGLPLPMGRVVVEDGFLSTLDEGTTWVLIPARLQGSAYEIAVQEKLATTLDVATATAQARHPGIEVMRLGAVFYAREGARSAMGEVDDIATISVIGGILLVALVFRSLMPLILTQLSIAIGVGTGFAAALLLFSDLHVMAILLGLSLIGVVADYSFYYCAQVFSLDRGSADARLSRVMSGITMGLLATMASYAILLLAPLPGIRQLAVIAIAGLIGSYATVVLWYPLIDRSRPRDGGRMLQAAAAVWHFWEAPRWRGLRLAMVAALLVLGVIGAVRFHIDDDVRRLQSLAPDLVRQQARIQALAGAANETQFFVVSAPDDEAALRRTETLLARLESLRSIGALASWRAPASFVPSLQRQEENRRLIAAALGPAVLQAHLDQLGLAADRIVVPPAAPLTLAEARRSGALDEVLSDMIVTDGSGGVAHIVLVEGLTRRSAAQSAARGVDGTRFVDPAADFSELLGRYRQRALGLVAISAIVVTAMVAVRFGWRGGLRIMLPALAAALLAPLLRSFSGTPFTFFDAMALILVLGINVDYAIFCADSVENQKPVALLGVWMTMISTLMSFGLLAISKVPAVHAFGATTALGVLLAALLAPLAAPARRP